jgi:hypothetical protein
MDSANTIFFRTRFFQALIALEPEPLQQVTQRLDELDLRPVLSRTVLLELLADDGRPAAQSRTAKAMLMLRRDSLILEAKLSWGMLAVTGDNRRALASQLRQAASFSRLAKATEDPRGFGRAVTEIGFDAALSIGAERARAVTSVLLPLLARIGVDLGETQVDADSSASLHQMGMRKPDARRMSEFILFADSIDRYQLHEIQLDALSALGEKHPLQKAGLAERCFAAASDDPFQVIDELAKTLR